MSSIKDRILPPQLMEAYESCLGDILTEAAQKRTDAEPVRAFVQEMKEIHQDINDGDSPLWKLLDELKLDLKDFPELVKLESALEDAIHAFETLYVEIKNGK